jgi:hypothetical protein
MAMLKAVCMASLLCCVSSAWSREDGHKKCAKIPDAALPGHNHWHLNETPWYVEQNVTVEYCTKACRERGCSSFDWYKNTMECDLSETKNYLGFNLSDLSASHGGGLKYGNRGYPYDHYACESIAWDLACVNNPNRKNGDGMYRFACDPYWSLQIMVIPNAAIAGHNTKRLTKQTLESCAQACFKQSWCKSFDWHKHADACDLSDKSAADVGGLKHDYSGNPYDHFALVCNNYAQEYRDQHYMEKKYQDQQIMERIMERAPMMNTSFFRACMGSISLGGIAMGFLVLRRARKQTGHGEDAIMAQMSGTTSGEE